MTSPPPPTHAPPPAVSVLMAVHNGARHLPAAMQSMLDQTWGDFELIVVDDASSDASPAVLAACQDPRLSVLRNEHNRGLTASLNHGLTRCRAPLIARMDADDVCEPTRFAEQVRCLREHPEVDLLGTHTTEIDDQDRVLDTFEPPGDPAYIAWEMTRGSIVYHPSWMVRREAFDAVGGYDERYPIAQDYALLAEMITGGRRVMILPKRLLRYRRGGGSLTQTSRPQMADEGRAIRGRYNRRLLGAEVSDERLERASRWLGFEALPAEDRDHLRDTLALVRWQARAAVRLAGGGGASVEEALLRRLRFRSDDARAHGRAEEARVIGRRALTLSPRAVRMRDLWRRALSRSASDPASQPGGPS